MKDNTLKNILTVLAILLMITLLGLLIYNFWNPQNDDTQTTFKQVKDTTITNNQLLVNKASKLYEQAKNIYLGNSNYMVLNNNKPVVISINNQEYEQYQTVMLNNTFSTSGIASLLKYGNIIKKDNLYYRAVGNYTENSNFKSRKFVVIKQNDYETTFSQISTYCKDTNCKEEESITRTFIIEKEDNTWKIKKWEIDT